MKKILVTFGAALVLALSAAATASAGLSDGGFDSQINGSTTAHVDGWKWDDAVLV